MKKKIMQEWVAALRSGTYEQGKGALEKDGKYCCLGVLCDIAAQKGVCLTRTEEYLSSQVSYDSSFGVLPNSVKEWSGIKDEMGRIKNMRSLVNLNDNGKSFEQIANIIEDNYKKL